ncbi:DNA polymerase III subunit alpha [Domibacillus epiphyticus]|uniref:DNA polymerase III subunit alpha n=1 Tax=Domibacillus epiphyticus TaxID=1714355 RepID=A0A1V2A962_9BACI|nr:DNA polymerase III subunit alpha [Domibacillus epiphyticus]OMP67460.1 DNA polymerase III subunit alpha [Domibacillus epiphyticus]
MFIHLETETAFSFRAATLTPHSLVDKAVEAGCSAIALTDFNTLHAAIPFYRACMEKGIKPIIGLKASIQAQSESGQSFPLLLYAKNETGLSHLVKISSAIQTKAKDGLPLKWLEAYAAGLVAVMPGMDGEVTEQAAVLFKKLFEQFYIGIRGYDSEQVLRDMAEITETPLVAIGNVLYADKKDAFASRCLQAIRENRLLDTADEMAEPTNAFETIDEIKKKFLHIPEAVKNTEKIARLCQVTISFGERLIPSFPLPAGETAGSLLKKLCMEGLGDKSKVYMERLSYELTVISRMKFSDYFLIVHDFMAYAKSQSILTGPGRGSAAGSLVAFALGITNVDPIKFELLFERFLNPERITMPDIDIDFPDNRREEIIQYIVGKYGALNAAQIVTFGTLSAKAVMRDVARVFGLDSAELSRLSKQIPSIPGTKLAELDLIQWMNESPVNERIYRTALQLEGLPRHTSTHAAGMIISEEPLTNRVPVMDGHNGVYLTQYAMEALESIGLLKIDLLGLRNLTIIERILSSIKRMRGKSIDLNLLPLDDPRVFELLSKGKTGGIFQFESDGMKKVLMQLKPDRFEDMVAVNALYRPGPMEQIPVYIKRRHGEEKVTYLHPILESILKPTYGIIVYQEQIIKIAVEMAGFTPGEADMLRRAVSKKKKEVLEEERRHFLNGATQKGIEGKTASGVYDLIVRFADYGFNRSHAVAYSMIAYWLAWLKAHYPAHFLASLLQSSSGNEEKLRHYIAEAAEFIIPFLAPSVNKSGYSFQAVKEGIRFGLVPVKGIGQSTAKAIIEERRNEPYKDLFDFCLRVPSHAINRSAIESLIISGAMDEFGQDRAVLLASIDAAIEHAALLNTEEGSLFEGLDISFKPKYTDAEEMPGEIKLEKEKEVLGVYVSDHPLTSLRPLLTKTGAIPLLSIQTSSHVQTAGLIGAIREIRTKKGDKMVFMTVLDETGERDAVVFPDVYRNAAALIKKGARVYITGAAEERNNSVQIVVQKILPLDKGINQVLEEKQTLYIKLPEGTDTDSRAERVYRLLMEYPGFASVVIHYERTKETVRLGKKYLVSPEKHLLNALKEECGTKNVVLK